jgi:hypothetical protein
MTRSTTSTFPNGKRPFFTACSCGDIQPKSFEAEREPMLRDVLARMVEYRRHVLAIFEALLDTESRTQRVQ